MLLDHKLSQHWHEFHHMPLPDFAASVYSQLVPLPQTAPRYDDVRLAMSQGDWLSRYQTEQQILHALSRISQRLKRPADLAAIGTRCLQDFQPELEQAILVDYQAMIQRLQDWLKHCGEQNQPR
nr:ACP phosphodiesterase [Neiella litorisoli]